MKPTAPRTSLALIAFLALSGGCGGSNGSTGDAGDGDGDGRRVGDGGSAPTSLWAPQAWEDCEGDGRALEAGPDDYRTVVDSLAPGDTLSLRPGTYVRGLPLRNSGSPGGCIVVQALDPAARPVFEGSNSFNIIAVHGASWLKVRNLDIDGLGLAGFGVASQGGDGSPTHHVVIEGLDMVGLGGDQQIVGVSTKSPAWDWVVRGNRIVGAGTGMYFGNSNGAAPFIRGVIELNTILDTIGYNAQIKHQNPRPDLAEMPADGAQTLIRWNVFSKAKGASSTSARPNFLIGHLPLSGSGQNDLYLVYGNFFYDNPTENLMQAEGNLAIYANVMVNPNGGALLVAPHNDVPRKVDVFLNTIVVDSGRGIRVSGGDANFTQRVRYNAVFGGEVSADDSLGNLLGDAAAAASALVDVSSMPGAGLDLHPSGAALEMTIDPAQLPALDNATSDFDGRLRTSEQAGAYDGPAGTNAVPIELRARSY